jgi:hypothetical protein
MNTTGDVKLKQEDASEKSESKISDEPWRRIYVIKGKYSGKYGYILRLRGEHFYYVALDDIPGEVYIKRSSFEFVKIDEASKLDEVATDQSKIANGKEKYAEVISPDAVTSWVIVPKFSEKLCEKRFEKAHNNRVILPDVVSSWGPTVSSTESSEKENFDGDVSPEVDSSGGLKTSSNQKIKTFECGQIVRCIGTDRKLKNKTGTITGKDRHLYIVTISGTNEIVRKTAKTLELADSSDFQNDWKDAPLSPTASTKRSQRDQLINNSKEPTLQSTLMLSSDDVNK